MTPRKFKSQLDVHKFVQEQMHGVGSEESSTNKQVYIDQIPNW